MAERASMPTFVPRTVASFERTATAVARRVAAPVRMLATRALSFADRLVGNWTGATSTVGGFESGVRPTMRSATRGGGMLLPRPWYEVDSDEDAIWPQQAARAAQPTSAPMARAATSAPLPAAERGAAIGRTTLTAPDSPTVRATTRSSTADPAAPLDATTTSSDTQWIEGTASDVRVADALGLRAPIAVPASIAATPAVRATTPLGRALAHAAWVDTQLRLTAPAPRTTAAATTGYVFIAPADVERPMVASAAVDATVAPTALRPPLLTATPEARLAPSVSAWSPQLPDPRLAATTATPIAQRVADFVARLVGVQTARDAAPLSPSLPAAVSPAIARDAAVARTYVELAAASPTSAVVSWRPGAAGARVEQLGARVDARVSAAWGEPAASPAHAPRVEPVASVSTPTVEARAAGAAPLPARTLVAPTEAGPRATGPARLAQFVQDLVGVQAARATAPLPVQALVAAIARAAKSAAAATAPLATTSASARAPERVPLATTIDAPRARTMAVATAPTAATGVTRSAPIPTPMAMSAATAMPATAAAPGAVGRRAEQLGGVVGVRAASLSIDFVDPARLSMLTGAAPTMPTVESAADPVARETIMPSPRPLFAGEASPAPAAALTAEEWSLVATFPSAATAMQLAGARQSAQWSGQAAGVVEMPARPLVSALAVASMADPRGVVRERPVAAAASRAAEPSVYVAPTVAAAETQGRLPGGRTPRGSFTWPKLAESSTAARAEWTAPATVAAADHAKLAAPGTPLWGSLPPLIAVSPSLSAGLAASAGTSGAIAPSATTAPPSAGSATRSEAPLAASVAAASLSNELVRADGGGAAPSAPATSDATSVDAVTGRAAPTRNDAPALTLMTAAATREARAHARMGARSDGNEPDGSADGEERAGAPLPLTGASGGSLRAGGGSLAGVSNVRPAVAMPLMTAGPTARDGGAATGAKAGPAARALELARPFLRLVESGIGSDGGPRSSSPRFFDQPQPLVAGAPSNDSASRIVEALRSQPAAASGDDRVSLADLTLIAIASATQQVAASPAGGGPGGGGGPAAPAAAAPQADHGHGAGRSGNPAQEIEELARAAFDELQRLMAIARERSGDHG